MYGNAGWSGNQVVGGLLLQTTRHTVVKSCGHRFSKFQTVCTAQQAVYDAETGKEVVQADVVEGLAPYGVDAVFLASSTEYKADLAVGECIQANRCERLASHSSSSSLHSLLWHAGIGASIGQRKAKPTNVDSLPSGISCICNKGQ